MLTYNFNSNQVRVLVKDDDRPYFVVEDICEILKIPTERLSDKEKTMYNLDGQEVAVTSEFGLYDLFLDSVGEREFKRWILRKILPTVRESIETKSETLLLEGLIYILAIRKEVNFDQQKDESSFSLEAVSKLTGVKEEVIKSALFNSKNKLSRIIRDAIPNAGNILSRWINDKEMLSDSIVLTIIEHYAFYVPHVRARDIYRMIAPIGLRNWVKQAVQYVKKDDINPGEVLASIDEKLDAIQQSVQELKQQLTE